MQDLNTTVLGVQGRQTRTQKTIYDIQLGDGNTYTTFNAQLANKAYGLVQQNVTARVEVKPSQDGRFTNYTLEDIAPQGQLQPMAFPVAGGTPAVPGAPTQAPVGGAGAPASQIPMAAPNGGGNRGMTEEDKARISRFAAQGTAFDFVATIYAGLGPEALAEAVSFARSLTEELLTHGYTGSYSAQPTPTPQATTPQAVAEEINNELGEGAVQTGSEVPWER